MSDIEKNLQNIGIIDVQLRNSKIDVRDGIEFHEINTPALHTQTFRRAGAIRESEFLAGEGEDEGKCWRYNFDYVAGIRQLLPEELKDAEENDEFVPIIEIVAVFRAQYISVEKLDEEFLSSFSENNVPFNVWPFWREYVHSTCTRLGYYPVLDIPLLKWRPPGSKKK